SLHTLQSDLTNAVFPGVVVGEAEAQNIPEELPARSRSDVREPVASHACEDVDLKYAKAHPVGFEHDFGIEKPIVRAQPHRSENVAPEDFRTAVYVYGGEARPKNPDKDVVGRGDEFA